MVCNDHNTIIQFVRGDSSYGSFRVALLTSTGRGRVPPFLLSIDTGAVDADERTELGTCATKGAADARRAASSARKAVTHASSKPVPISHHVPTRTLSFRES